ncbi:MAG: helix-turn-helix domain-containing protein, partial [Proteobacteria bacterium]|nr:helix-turn-helix domain-containing protein [Pseudomonadota bacterium]
MVNFSKNGTNGGGEPVRLDAWVASKHPRLHPTRRMVLKVVASLCRDGEWATSSEVRESTDLSQQLLNRHLRGLESDGMLRIVKPGSGLPLNVRPTSMGLRLLGQAESRQVSEEPSWEEPQDQYQPQDEPEAQTPAASDGVSALARRLYQQLEKHLLDLDRRQTEELLARTLRDLGVTPEA